MTDYTLIRSRRRTLSMELKRDGTLVAQGTHRQLLAKKGFYPEIYTSQYAI